MKQKVQKYPQINEEELLQTIEIISKKLSYKFKFGYHEIEDMKQQISVFAIEGLQNYDYKRPLENFLWTHVRNRLFNFKRDNYQRPDKPCNNCPLFDKLSGDPSKDCLKYKNKNDCDLYTSWYSRNSAKKNLMYLNTIEELKEYLFTKDKTQSDNAQEKELLDILDEELYGELREIYLKIKMGNKVYKHEFNKLVNKIKELINE
jgi:DNA-directed RNA polymerase specialized sigma24 family protein